MTAKQGGALHLGLYAGLVLAERLWRNALAMAFGAGVI